MSDKTDKKQIDKPWLFKKGESGNPNGRPKGSGISITTEIKKKLEEVPKGQKSTYLQLLINRILKQAIQDGDERMITRIWNYIDGMPRQPIEHSGEIENKTELIIRDGKYEPNTNTNADTNASESGE